MLFELRELLLLPVARPGNHDCERDRQSTTPSILRPQAGTLHTHWSPRVLCFDEATQYKFNNVAFAERIAFITLSWRPSSKSGWLTAILMGRQAE